MRLAATTRAVGLTLARDLPAKPGSVPLLRAGATISDGFAQTLVARHGIHAVWVDDRLSEGIEPLELLPEHIRMDAAVTVARSIESAQAAFAANRTLPHQMVAELSAVVEGVIASLIADPGAALALYDLAAADEYTHRHSVDVMALGLLLARQHLKRHGWRDYRGQRRFDGVDERLTRFGMGLVLHDIGKAAIPIEVLNKPGRLTEDEQRVMREHPTAGVAMLPVTTSPVVLVTVRQHHERWDGSGYPAGLEADGIHELARIAAVADVYDAVTSARPYKDAAPPSVGVGVIVDGAGTAFDPSVVETFRRVVLPYPLGSEVELPDGRVAIVADVDPARPAAPTVRVMDEGGTICEVELDLRALTPA